MKKGKVFTKGQAAVALMVVALGAAVWLNMKFTGGEKYLGQASYVSGESEPETVETSAKTDEKDTDYFTTAVSERNAALKEAQELVEETLKSANITEEEKKAALNTTEELAKRVASAQNIESLLKAKGFKKVVAVIGENNVSVVVSSDSLDNSQTLQIQDIVTSETGVPLSNITIVAVK